MHTLPSLSFVPFCTVHIAPVGSYVRREHRNPLHLSAHLEPYHSTENLKQKPVTDHTPVRDVFIRNTVRPDKQFRPRADSFPPFFLKKKVIALHSQIKRTTWV